MCAESRVKYSMETRQRAIGLFEAGYGSQSAARVLGISPKAVRKWQLAYQSAGAEALLRMGEKRTKYTYEQKVAAASAVVDRGVTKPDAMREFGIMSASSLDRWCKLYREGSAAALEPKTVGRPKNSGFKDLIARARSSE